MDANTRSLVRRGGRAAQFVTSLIAMATIAGGFHNESAFGLTQQLGSHATNFGLLMTYTTMLYSAYVLVAIEHLRVVPRPPFKVDLIIDGIMAVILFIAGIVVATSDFVSNCDAYGFMLRCGNLTAGTVFTFLAGGAFLITLVLAYMTSCNDDERGADLESAPQTIPYVSEVTPKGPQGPLSPMGAAIPSPNATKV